MIAFDTNGILVDGQHRLKACAESGVSLQTDVAFGVPPHLRNKWNIGRSRTAAHMAHMAGVQNATGACALAALLLIHEKHGIQKMNNPRCKPTRTQANLDAQRRADMTPAILRSKHFKKRMAAPRVIAFCYYLFSKEKKELADRFFDELHSGAGLSADNPVFQLRERLTEKTKGKLDDLYVIALFFKTWRAYRAGKRIKCLRWCTDGPTPEAFPMI